MTIKDTIAWARKHPGIKMPEKVRENAGFDIYGDFKCGKLIIPPHFTNMISTGLFVALPVDYWLEIKERGSLGSKGIGIRCGVIDSGYRGEIFIAITNHNDKDFVFADDFNGDYPMQKAICQAIIHRSHDLASVELSFTDLMLIESDRGTGKLGSSGK